MPAVSFGIGFVALCIVAGCLTTLAALHFCVSSLFRYYQRGGMDLRIRRDA